MRTMLKEDKRKRVLINLNDTVRISLTPKGREAIQKSYDEIGLTVPDRLNSVMVETQLWEVMSLLGNNLEMGFDVPMSPDIVVYISED